jgi:hypothetical protein
MTNDAPLVYFVPALESLRSVRHFVNIALAHQAVQALQYAIGSLFLLIVIRGVVRQTWIAVGSVALLNIPLAFRGDSLSWWELILVVGTTLFALTVLLHLGLLACVVMLFFTESFARGPAVTLDVDAWYLGTSIVTLLVVAAVAMYGFTIVLGGRRVFDTKPV